MELRFVDGVNNELNIKDDVIACIGEFDGLHIAHQELVNETLRLAKKHNMMSALITFYPHPDYVIGKREYEANLKNLDTLNRELQKLAINLEKGNSRRGFNTFGKGCRIKECAF